MEPWQREHIRKNFMELQEWTICNEQLLACLRVANALSLGDLDILRATKSSKGELAQSTLLYEILEKRVGAYKKLIDALDHCKQSGASKILTDGFSILNTSPIDILTADVLLQGQVFKLQELFPGINEQILSQIWKKAEVDDDYNIDNLFKNNNNTLVLTTNTIPIPPLQSVYIPRSISRRRTVNPDIFKRDSDEVFVFKGIDRLELYFIVRPFTTSESSQQVLEVTSRFIILENEKDWEKIRAVSTSPTHLIRAEKITRDNDLIQFEFILEASTGGSDVLSKPSALPNEKIFIFEDEFIDMLENESEVSGYCICDTPGMGKSVLLQNLARQMAQKFPKRIVAYIPLSHLVLRGEHGNNPLSKTNELSSIKLVLELISSSKFSQALLLWAIQTKSIQLELFFDGLDEVAFEHLEWTKEFLNDLVKSDTNLRLYVTSRPHFRKEIEQLLGVIAYDILPFTHENQLEFLVTFWKQKISNWDMAKLNTFADKCLRSLNIKCKEEENDILGIPLQCLLLAEVHTKGAEVFCDPASNIETPFFKSTSVYEMYRKFIELRLGLLEDDSSSTIYVFHVWTALKLIFPEIFNEFSLIEKVEQTLPISFACSFGLLHSDDIQNNQTLSFIHRTVAEYIIAYYLIEIMMSKPSDYKNRKIIEKKFITYIGTQVFLKHQVARNKDWYFNENWHDLITFHYDVMFYFLNGCLSTAQGRSVDERFVNMFLDVVQPVGFYQILKCSTYHNHLYLFRFLTVMLEVAKKRTFNKITNYLTGHKSLIRKLFVKTSHKEHPPRVLLLITSKYSSADIMHEIFRLFKEQFCFDLDKFCKQWDPLRHTPLEAAVKRGNYELVEYLIDKFSFKLSDLLHKCIYCSYMQTNDMAKSRLKICKLLYQSNLQNCDQRDLPSLTKTFWKTFLARSLHLEFYKYFIRESDNVFETRHRKSIVHSAAFIMSPRNFHELCVIINERDAAFLFQQNYPEWDSPLHYILKNVETLQVKTLIMILEGAKINVNITDDHNYGHRNNLIQSAILGNQNIDLIKTLVDRGGDFKYKNKNGENVLHLTAAKGNIELLKYLLSLEVSLEERDGDGNTPLLCAYEHLETIKCLIDAGADIYATDMRGENFVHKAARYVESSHKFYELIVFISNHPLAVNLLSGHNNDRANPILAYLKAMGIWGAEVGNNPEILALLSCLSKM